MDFARPLVETASIASQSRIRYLDEVTAETAVGDTPEERERNVALDNQVIRASNETAFELFMGQQQQSADGGGCAAADHVTVIHTGNIGLIDSSHYTERSTPVINGGRIRAGDLVVIQESFDKLDFVYCKSGEIYSNRNGNFHHDDFINQPFGTKVRSRDLKGYGFLFLLKPTPELWTRSLNHRTQVVHELDQSQIVFQLYLQPNDVVVESGTGSGAMSHALIRTIAPHGHVHTYEFNQHRAETARTEFRQHGLANLVTVHHKDVCRGLVAAHDEDDDPTNGNQPTKNITAVREGSPGFDLPGQSVDAVVLDLPEPWLAVPHAAFILKPNGRIATYSPCMEQTQRTVEALETAGFHSCKTLEYRLQEHYVDEVEYESPPAEKRPRPEPHNVANYPQATAAVSEEDTNNCSDAVTEMEHRAVDDATTENVEQRQAFLLGSTDAMPQPEAAAVSTANGPNNDRKRKKKLLVARPFVMMRGHTAFLTFATAGLEIHPNPNVNMAESS